MQETERPAVTLWVLKIDICTLEDTMDRLFCEFLCVHLPWKHLPWYDGICRSLWPDAYYYLAFLKFVRNMISRVTGIFSEHIYSYILYLCTIQSVHKAGLADLILSQRALRYPCGAVGSFRINILTCYSAAMLEGHVGWLKTTYSSMESIQINIKINMFTLVYTSNFWPHQP